MNYPKVSNQHRGKALNAYQLQNQLLNGLTIRQPFSQFNFSPSKYSIQEQPSFPVQTKKELYHIPSKRQLKENSLIISNKNGQRFQEEMYPDKQYLLKQENKYLRDKIMQLEKQRDYFKQQCQEMQYSQVNYQPRWQQSHYGSNADRFLVEELEKKNSQLHNQNIRLKNLMMRRLRISVD